MKTIMRAIVVTITAVILLSFSPGTALAAQADLNRNVFLTSTPTSAMDTARMSRSIYLAAGYYSWTTGLIGTASTSTVGSAGAGRNLYVSSGTYTWACDLVPGSGTYRTICSVSRPGVSTAWLTSANYTVSQSGNYVLSSTLNGR